jgi:hypothetical protein
MERDVLPQGGETLPTEENVLERGETQPEDPEAVIARLLRQNEQLREQLRRYEQNGAAKLYYALNRKQNEMADLLNNKLLKDLQLDDPKDKTFDRLKVIWNDAASIATAAKTLGEVAGVTQDEKKDIERKPFNDRLAEERR